MFGVHGTSIYSSALLSLPNQRPVLPAILELARQVITADAYALWRMHPTSPHPFSELEIRVATALSHLAAASRILGTSLDYQTTLAGVAELTVTRRADWCGVYLVNDNGAPYEIVVRITT